jgi:tetratricopeptide (TPR) repeat protein
LKRRRTVVLAAAAALIGLLAGVLWFVLRQPLRRRRGFVPVATRQAPKKTPVVAVPPVEQWTATFEELEAAGRWKELDGILSEISLKNPEQYMRFSLGYLQARTRIEMAKLESAEQSLAPFLAADNPLRDLALFHRAEIADARDAPADASAARQELIFAFPRSLYGDQAIDDELQALGKRSNPAAMMAFVSRLYPTADTRRRRDLDAATVEALFRSGQTAAAIPKALALLTGGTTDDPSDRVARALDKPELLGRLTAEQLVTLGEAFRNHRHFDRAIAVLSMAVPRLPLRRDELQFAIGRCYFGSENYTSAESWYLRGANTTRDAKARATFLFHASRTAQLRGDDAAAERLMTGAIAVPGRFPATTAALTQRIRTRLAQRRFVEAASDLGQLRKIAPKDHDSLDAAVAYGVAMIANRRPAEGLTALGAAPKALVDRFDPSEITYWRGRALEPTDVARAIAAYILVLRATVPTHFAYFARERLAQRAMDPAVAREIAARRSTVAQLIKSASWDKARQGQTDVVLLSRTDRQKDLETLAAIYRQLPAYRAVLDLKLAPLPTFSQSQTTPPDRFSMLMSMGLFDDAADLAVQHWGLRPLSNAFTQSYVLNRGAASKQSIYAIEVMMNGIPRDFVPDLLPLTARELLYPRYFYGYIESDSRTFDADPILVLSIMREESRFNPRAKSEAAARGLLQFIITTARDIGRDVGLMNLDPEDLYDPRIIIRLGSRYISELTKKFSGDHYKAAAAYNAGPNQVALWSRLAAAPGDDFFLSSINFEETKDYVRKVMNSYQRYAELYSTAGPVGGLRAEP